MKIDQLKPGMVVYSVEKRKTGNTTVSTMNIFKVQIIEVTISPEDLNYQKVLASWNGNTPRNFGIGSISKWKKEPPTVVRGRLSDSLIRLEERKDLTSWLKTRLQEGEKCPACNMVVALPHRCLTVLGSKMRAIQAEIATQVIKTERDKNDI
jgi:hypothetical protein